MKLVHMRSEEDACAAIVQSLDLHMNENGTVQTCAVFDLDDTIVLRSGDPRVCVQSLLDTCKAYNVNVFIVTARVHTLAAESETHAEIWDSGVTCPYTLHMRPNAVADIDIPQWKYDVRCQIAAASGHMLFSIGDQWWDVVSCSIKIEELEGRTDPSSCFILTDRSPTEPARAGVKLPER